MSAIENLITKLARVQVDPYVARRGEKIVPVIRHFRSMDDVFNLLKTDRPEQLQFKGMRTRKPKAEPTVIAGPDPADVQEAIEEGNDRFIANSQRLGGNMPYPKPLDPFIFDSEGVSDEQRAESERLIAKFMKTPAMQPYFDRFGRPTFIIANRTDEGQDPRHQSVAGQTGSVMAAWRAGVITMFGPTIGDVPWQKEQKIPARGARAVKASSPNKMFGTVIDWSGRDAVIRHEYGHQVMVQAFDPSRPDGASSEFGGLGGNSVWSGLFAAIFGKPGPQVEAEMAANPGDGLPDDLQQDLIRAVAPLSAYAVIGGPQEAAAEAFAVVTDPRYDRETSPYPPETQRLLDYIESLME
jgi:hypothetical protein